MSAHDARIGTTIGGKYRISRFLAQGGMGTVYEAQHLVVKRRFAVKFLRAEFLRRRDMLARFQLEAQSAGALESENIAAAIDFGLTADGHPYLVMEYLDGIDLAALLGSQGPLPFGRAADLVAQACSGMQRAHDAGVIHRDLKPQNLFVCRRSDQTDLVKIVDFGVAKLLDVGAMTGLTSTGGMVGTPSYMSPEQARGESHIDPRTDVYALGVIAYELLSGRTPHPGESHNAIIHHISTQPPLPLAATASDVPAPLIAAIERALSPDPSLRQSSAAELESALLPFAQRRIWPAVSGLAAGLDSTVLDAADDTPKAAKIPSDVSAAPLENSGPRAAPRRSVKVLSLAALLVAGALAVFVLALNRRPSAPPPVLAPSEPALSVEAQRERPPDVHASDRPALDVQSPTVQAASAAAPVSAPEPVAPAEPRVEPRPVAKTITAASKAPAPREPPPSSKPKTAAEAAPQQPAPAAKPKSPAAFDDQNPY